MKVEKKYKAIILAAGEGIRLRPYTLDRPKCLVEVDGISLLHRQLSVLNNQSIEQIVVIGGYRSDMLLNPRYKLRVNNEYSETNMIWTLFTAEDELNGDVIISYGDIVYSKNILQSLISSDADIAVVIDLGWEDYWQARNENVLADAETLKLSKNGQILEIGKKPESLDQIEGQYMGLMKFSARGLDILKEVFYKSSETGSLCGKPVEKAYMTDLIQAIIDSGYDVSSVQVDDAWVEVDTVSDLQSNITRDRLNRIALSN